METNPDNAFRKSFKPLYLDSTISKKTTDVSVTYDGQTIVSDRFRLFLESEGNSGLRIISFARDPGHFQLQVDNVVPVNRDKVQFVDRCPDCGNFNEVFGDYERLAIDSPLIDGFFRTDVFFGSGDSKSPQLVVGQNTGQKIKTAKFKGCYLTPAIGCGLESG